MTFPLDNEFVADWFIDVLSVAPHSEGSIVTAGSDPWPEAVFDNFLERAEVDLIEMHPSANVIIIGRDFGSSKSDLKSFHEVLESRQGKTLSVYSQEMYLAYWFTGSDPFADVQVANGFVAGHPGLELISSQWFGWSTARVEVSKNATEYVENNASGQGMLSYFGYSVSKKAGLTPHERQAILAKILSHKDLPDINEPGYKSLWGEANSKIRLQKMKDCLSMFAHLHAQKGNTLAASRYNDDLDWLRSKFYTGKHNFAWQKTKVVT